MKRISLILAFISIHSALNAQCTYTLVPIDSIQRVGAADLALDIDLSYLDGDTVCVQGVVMFDPCDYALSSSGSRVGTFLQTVGGGPWSGVEILIETTPIGYSGTLSDLDNDIKFIDNFVVGQEVRATGLVGNYSGETQLYLLPEASTIISISPPAIEPDTTVTIDLFMLSDGAGGFTKQTSTGEQYEGTYVEFRNVTIVDVASGSAGRYFWSLQDAAGNKIQIRDISGHLRNGVNDDFCTSSGVSNTPDSFDITPLSGAFIDYVRGIIVEYSGSYYLAPTDTSDIGSVTLAPPFVQNTHIDPVVPKSTDMVTVSARITDFDGTISSTKLFYSYGFETTVFDSATMSLTGTDTFSATVPASGVDEQYVMFYIKSIDNDGNVTIFPNDSAHYSFYQTLDDGIDDIYDIQYTPVPGGSSSIWNGDSILGMNVEGIVTATNALYDLSLVTIQDGTDPWNGLFLRSTSGLEDLKRGDKINITSGTVRESFGVTYLDGATFTVVSSGNPIPGPITSLNPDSLHANKNGSTEPYEAMFLRFEPTYVTDTNADAPSNFGEFEINITSKTTGLRVDDFSTDIPMEFGTDSVSVGDSLGFIQGILHFTFGNWKLTPRNLSDIDGFNTIYPNQITGFSFLSLTPVVNGVIDEGALTIDCVVPMGTSVTALVPTITYTSQSVAPASGVANDFTTPQTYTTTAPISADTKDYTVTVTEGTGLNEIGPISGIDIHPNPTKDNLFIGFEVNENIDLEMNIMDLSGRIFSSEKHQANGKFELNKDVSQLPAGMYILHIRSGEYFIQRTFVKQ